MSDRVVRQLVTVLVALAVLAVVLDVPSVLRVPVVVGFAMLAPGLATTRFVPTLSGVDKFALGAAMSLSMNILASLFLVATGRWSGEPVLALLVGVTLLLTFLPQYSPRRQRHERAQRLHNQEIRRRRRAQASAYDQVVSADPAERSSGLVALSWLLEEDGRTEEAARLRALSRLVDPPRLPLQRPDTLADTALRDAHQRARSDDPETRRQGLFEVAGLLDRFDQPDEAATLRDLANRNEVPDL